MDSPSIIKIPAINLDTNKMLSKGNKIIPLEIKSSATRNHESIENFVNKYSKKIYKEYLFSQKDAAHVGQLLLKPLYLLPFMLEEF